MSRRRGAAGGLRPALLVVLAGLLWASAGTAPGRGPEGLPSLVPESGAVPGWARDGQAQEFAGEDLYTYIDGGAEIYQEYGFRGVVVQDFKDASDRSVSLEIFEMAAPEAAYGMYTFKRSGKGKLLSLGAGGDLEDYYLNFWKGRFLVTLTGFDESPETLAGVQALAGAVDAKIADKAAPPSLVAALPLTGLKPGSVKYLKGLLGLNNVYPFYTARGFDFQAAVKGDYVDGSTLLVLDYGPAGSGSRAWAELEAYLDATDRFTAAGEAGHQAARVYRDGRGRYVAFAPSGTRLSVGIGDRAAVALGRVR